ncbi:hypothetical protein N656DRAFT_841544 [Canariomyces notabilis]|uniref:Ankyrin repeat protein n=1 Tax=Canariomyces notabilis TaxID=2074819 RepID=A0AAN6TK86_9PEZI|nr:hypothetical protein N656DRAFT_841544 [Canariomyces arenarius]
MRPLRWSDIEKGVFHPARLADPQPDAEDWQARLIDEIRNENHRREEQLSILRKILTDGGERGHRALHYVAAKSEEEALELLLLLLDRPDIDVDMQDNMGMTALNHAARNRQTWCIRQLLSAGADSKAADIYGYLPRHHAEQYFDMEIISLFDNPEQIPQVGVFPDDGLQGGSKVAKIPFHEPLPEDEMERGLSEYFHGSFWEPSGPRKRERQSVWNLVYSRKQVDTERRQKNKKWFHLPASTTIAAKMGSDTVLTLYPERWNRHNEAKLHIHLLDQVSKNDDIQDRDLNMRHAAETLIRSCMSFVTVIQISYTTAFANSIGDLYLKAIHWYEQLTKSLGSLSVSPTKFYQSVEEGTRLLIKIDDIIGEIGMIRKVQMSQAAAAMTLSDALWGDLSEFRYSFRDRVPEEASVHGAITEARANREQQYTRSLINAVLESFSQLEADANRVRSMLKTLLDLRDREAALENAMSGKTQSTMLFIFTIITVLFAPLSFVSSLLALKIEDLPETWTKPPLAGVFGYATLATMGLSFMIWILHKILTFATAKQRNRPPLRPDEETVNETTMDTGRKTLSPWPRTKLVTGWLRVRKTWPLRRDLEKELVTEVVSIQRA